MIKLLEEAITESSVLATQRNKTQAIGRPYKHYHQHFTRQTFKTLTAAVTKWRRFNFLTSTVALNRRSPGRALEVKKT